MRFYVAIITICILLYAISTWGTTGDTTVVGPTFSFGNISTSNLKVRANRPSDRVTFVGSNNATVSASGKTITFFAPVVGGVVGFPQYSSGVSSRFRSKFLVQTATSGLPNAQAMSTLSTGIVKNTTTTGIQSIAVPAVDYVAPTAFNNYTSGALSRFNSTFITKTANPNLPNSQAMGALTTGMVKNTTTTGVQSIGVPSYDYVSGYAGLHAQPTITDNGNGTITVGTAECMLYDNVNYTGGVKHYTVAGGTFTPLNGVSSALAIDYNGGSPIMQIQVQGLANFSSNIPIVTMFRSGTTIDFLSWDATAQGLPEKILERFVRTERFTRQSGLTLGEAATRTITITGGITWNGVTKITLGAASSATDPTTLWAHVAGVYTPTSITQYNNTQYDNGTNLVALLPNKYAVNWVYRQEDATPEIHVLLGTAEYNLATAQASQPPSTLPEVVRTNSILVGRIIVKQADSTATQIDSAFNVVFSPSGATDHASLLNLDYTNAGHTGFVGYTGNTAALDMGANTVTGTRFISTIATGTAPLGVTSTTVVPNLNVDTTDGFHLNQVVTTVGTPSFVGMTLGSSDLSINGALAGGAGTASSGIFFGGTGVAHGNVAWMPNERNFAFHTGNTPTNLVDAYGVANILLNGSVSAGGNLAFTGTGNRITGDFSNATLSNRVAFQTSTSGSNTNLTVLPNGANTTSQVQVYNNSDPTNAARVGLIATSTDVGLRSTISGTGTLLPLALYMGTTEIMRATTTNNVLIGATTETAGAQKVQVTGDVYASGTVLAGGGANTIYWCNGTITGGNLCRGNACTGCAGTWDALKLKTD